MSNKYFIYLVLITISLFFFALLSFLIQPRYETSLKKGELIFENIKKELNDIKEINIDNKKKKKYRLEKIRIFGICLLSRVIKLKTK